MMKFIYNKPRINGIFFPIYLLRMMQIPFIILNIRIIQWKYEYFTRISESDGNNDNINRLLLLQSKEEYYESQFSAWGKYHPSFSFSNDQYIRHLKFMLWLFPKKKFVESEMAIEHKYDSVLYYKNLIYKLTKCKPPNYASSIKKQLDRWDTREKDLGSCLQEREKYEKYVGIENNRLIEKEMKHKIKSTQKNCRKRKRRMKFSKWIGTFRN